MAGPTCQLRLTASNRLAFGRPCPSVMCPPATSSRPSGRKSWPAQNSHEGLGTAVKLPVAGSHTCGSPMRPQLSTVPSGSRWTWSCTIGAGNTGDHRPTCASGPGVGFGMVSGGGVSGAVYATVMYGRWLGTGSSLLLKDRYRSRSLDGSEFNSRPKFVEGVVSHPWTTDAPSNAWNPGVLSMLFGSRGRLMTAKAKGIQWRQPQLGAHALTPPNVWPFAL